MSQPSEPAGFDIRPLMFASMACTMALMAFVAVVAPVARQLGLQPWQAGATVTVSGLVWMLLARRWGSASDHRGRRPMLLLGAVGVSVAYLAMCLAIDASLRLLPPVWLAFLAMMLSRSAVGAFYAAIPAVSQALIADHVPPAKRAGAMAAFGAASGVGLVLGPAAAAWLSQFSLAAPLCGMALLPLAALAVLWHKLPPEGPRAAHTTPPIRMSDVRLRRPMAVAFVAMFGVGIAQITVGFFALDRFGLDAAAAARVAGIALTMVGVALVLAQLLVRRLKLTPPQMIRIGGIVAACGFGSAVWVQSVAGLWAAYFVAAAGMGWVFPAFSALAANAVQPHEQGSTAGTIGAAQGLGMVAGPLIGTLVYALGPAVPYLLVAALLLVMALWPVARPAAVQGASA